MTLSCLDEGMEGLFVSRRFSVGVYIWKWSIGLVSISFLSISITTNASITQEAFLQCLLAK